jgi:hypothetical protein
MNDMLEMRTQKEKYGEKIAYLVVGVFAGALLGQLAFSQQTETKTVEGDRSPASVSLLIAVGHEVGEKVA